MPAVGDVLRQVLIPFLVTAASLLAALLAWLVIQRVVRGVKAALRRRLVEQYRPLTDAVAQRGPLPELVTRLRALPASHRRLVSRVMLAPLRTVRGALVDNVRETAAAIGLIEMWRDDATHRRWWRRADGVRALGLVEDRAALPVVIRAFEDEHEEVRAAAVEAAGRLGDLRTLPQLLSQLADGSRYQRARVIDALRGLGPPVTLALAAFGRAHPDQRRSVADVLGMIGTVAAMDPLLEWCDDERGDVRTAALAALGSIGLTDRSYYYVLRALGDEEPQARAMAARALGRARRESAAGYLANRLDDDWLPAAQAAAALQRLGDAGRAALEARARDEGQAGDLARQMLWTPAPHRAAA